MTRIFVFAICGAWLAFAASLPETFAAEPPGTPFGPLDVSTPLGHAAFDLVAFEGREALDEPFEFKLTMHSDASRGGDGYGRLLGEEIDFSMALARSERRFFSGICSRVSASDDPTSRGRIIVEATVVPRLRLLALNRNLRMFNDLTAPEAVALLLAERGIADYAMNLAETYRRREVLTQYKESDFDFIQRLMEEEGIYYFFVHTPAGGHRLVISDTAPTGAAYDIPYEPLDPADGTISRFTRFAQAGAGRAVLDDFNYFAPSTDLLTSATGRVTSFADARKFAIYDYPGGYANRAQGARRAAIAIESLQVAHEGFNAESRTRRFAAGEIFTMSDHPLERSDGKHLITSVQHRASLAAPGILHYECTIEGIDADVRYRPRRRTPIPRADGVQSAIVTVSPADTPGIDPLGRVKVKFPWIPAQDDTASTWIRVQQQHTTGAMVLPRVGWEVNIAFAGGVPDQPVILGSLPNAEYPPNLPSESSVEPARWRSYGK